MCTRNSPAAGWGKDEEAGREQALQTQHARGALTQQQRFALQTGWSAVVLNTSLTLHPACPYG